MSVGGTGRVTDMLTRSWQVSFPLPPRLRMRDSLALDAAAVHKLALIVPQLEILHTSIAWEKS